MASRFARNGECLEVRNEGRLFSFFAVTVLVTANLEAQTGQGTIVGLVNDKTGARIASVTVRVTNKETNVVANSSTNEGGLFRAPYLNPGKYDVVFESQGFKRLIRSDIEVRTAETVNLDVVLDVGSVAESIEVQGAAPLLETETSSTGHLVTAEQLTSLPTPQMKIETVLWYVPGVTSQSGSGHVAGGRDRAFNMVNDGVSAMDPGVGALGWARTCPRRNTTSRKSRSDCDVVDLDFLDVVFRRGHVLAQPKRADARMESPKLRSLGPV